MNFRVKIFFVFILCLTNTNQIVMQSIQLINSVNNYFSLDLCLIDQLNYLFQHHNTLKHPLIIMTPDDERLMIHFTSFIQQISRNQLWPHIIYDFLDMDTIGSNSRIVLFISSPDQIKKEFLEKLKYSHVKIHIIFFDKDATNSLSFKPKIERIFGLLAAPEFSYAIVFAQRESKYATWRMFAPLHQNCQQTSNHRLIGFCQFNGSDIDMLNSPYFEKKQTCALNILVTEYEPFTYFDRKKGFHKGIEISLVNTIAQKLNVKVNYIFHDIFQNADAING